MRIITFTSLLLFPLLASSQISLNQIDDFEDYTTKNWTKGSSSSLPNQNIATDGPNGTDDNFLRVQSDEDSWSNSKLVTFNNAQWQGDYIDEGITYISMDVRNSGSNTIQLRLAFENDQWTNDPKWSSTNAIAILPGEGWQTIVFPIDENSLTRLGHTNSYNGDFNDITEMRIIHNDAPNSLQNQNIATDGPNGTDDNFLRVQSNGGSGSDSKLVTFNNAQWLGDYVDEGVTYISMDVRNSGSNVIILRLAFENDKWTNDPKWCSTNAIAVIPGQGWKTIAFPIDDNSLTKLGHTNSYNGDFNDITELRIIHNDTPSWEGDPIDAILDIDNIQVQI